MSKSEVKKLSEAVQRVMATQAPVLEKLTAYERLEKERDELKTEVERLKEILSYLPKVPTQPYEKEMTQEIERLKATNLYLQKNVADKIADREHVQLLAENYRAKYEKAVRHIRDFTYKNYDKACLQVDALNALEELEALAEGSGDE